MRIRALALVGGGVLVAFAVAAQETSDRPASSWAAPPYWLPAGVLPAAGSEAAEAAPEAVEPVVVRALPLVAIPPCRLLDTRGSGLPVLIPGAPQEIPISGRCGVPSGAQGVSVRMLVPEPAVGGEVFLGAAGGDGARAGSLALEPGEPGSIAGVVGLDESGRLVATAEGGSVHVVVEVNGYYAAEPAVRSLNAVAGDVTLEAGENVEITTEGSVVTIAIGRGRGSTDERPGEPEPPVPGTHEPVRHLVQVPASHSTRTLPPVKAMAPPSSSMYVAGALGMPNTTALGAGVLTLGGDRFLHNYGPDLNAANTFLGENAGNFTMGGPDLQGRYNTGLGYRALVANTTGRSNTASGYVSLSSNTTGYDNTASGSRSLQWNTTGYRNTASGYYSLSSNTTGYGNTASGYFSLRDNTEGDYNTASGHEAGYINTTGSGNTFVGAYSDASADNLTNATAIGYNAVVNASKKVRIGNTSVTVIEGQVNFTASSDVRDKADVRDLDAGMEFIRALRPVAYRLREGNGRSDWGFIAQEVEAVVGEENNLVTVGPEPERKLGLRYADLIAPLVKAVQEQQELIETLQDRLGRLERDLEALRGARDRP